MVVGAVTTFLAENFPNAGIASTTTVRMW